MTQCLQPDRSFGPTQATGTLTSEIHSKGVSAIIWRESLPQKLVNERDLGTARHGTLLTSTRSRSGTTRFMIGRVAEAVARKAPTDILLIPPRRFVRRRQLRFAMYPVILMPCS